MQKRCKLLRAKSFSYPSYLCYLSLTLLAFLKWQAFKVYLNEVYFGKTRDQVATSINGIVRSQDRSYATERISLDLTTAIWFATLVQTLVMLLPENSKWLNAVQWLELHASVYLSLPPVLYYSPQYSTVQGCTAQYTLGEGRCCPDPEARTAPAQLTVSPRLSEVS